MDPVGKIRGGCFGYKGACVRARVRVGMCAGVCLEFFILKIGMVAGNALKNIFKQQSKA